MKYISFFIGNIFRIILEFLLSIFIIRDSKIIVMGLRTRKTKVVAKTQDYFMHNTKYLFLYLNSFKNDYKVIWLSDDNNQISTLKKYGYKYVFKRKSLTGIYYSLRAKYWFYDDSKFCINQFLSRGAICINMWHGIPLKKIGCDISQRHPKQKYKKNVYKIWNILREKDDFYIVNSEYEQNCYTSAYDTDNIIISGSPRNDILYNDIPNTQIFLEEDFETIKEFKAQGKMVFLYMPTFRDTGKNISGWINSPKLKELLIDKNSVLVCKLHFADKNNINFVSDDIIYKMDNTSDVYPILKYSDALITDYSSIYFDYLILDRPIIYFPFDIEEYQEKCRGFYCPYDELTAGVKVYTEQELLSAIKEISNGIDNYKEMRKALRDKMFKYQDGNNCKRVVEFIKSLDK